jgi:hypothetical protein
MSALRDRLNHYAQLHSAQVHINRGSAVVLKV